MVGLLSLLCTVFSNGPSPNQDSFNVNNCYNKIVISTQRTVTIVGWITVWIVSCLTGLDW